MRHRRPSRRRKKEPARRAHLPPKRDHLDYGRRSRRKQPTHVQTTFGFCGRMAPNISHARAKIVRGKIGEMRKQGGELEEATA
ncbi:hypothetical protein Trydic_g10807 [Trypoxylus dichotomus]